MKRLEEKARRIVREEYFEYKLMAHEKDSQYWYSKYDEKMDMLKKLFPKTTNQEQLERTWNAIWRKENR